MIIKLMYNFLILPCVFGYRTNGTNKCMSAQAKIVETSDQHASCLMNTIICQRLKQGSSVQKVTSQFPSK